MLALVSLATALWLASRYVAAFMRASNAIYDVPEGRPVWKTLPIRIGVTVVVMVLLAVSAVAVVATGGLAERLGRLLGIGRTAVRVWDMAKWPVLLLIVGFLFALLYWASPNARQPFRWITPGGSWPWWSGWLPRWPSGSMWPTSVPTTRPMAAWPA